MLAGLASGGAAHCDFAAEEVHRVDCASLEGRFAPTSCLFAVAALQAAAGTDTREIHREIRAQLALLKSLELKRFMRTRRESATVMLVPPAVRHFLLSGTDDPTLEGKWDVWRLLYGPLGGSREETANWIPLRRRKPYRAALRAEGLALPTQVSSDEIARELTTNHE
jgi:hypothetical protein